MNQLFKLIIIVVLIVGFLKMPASYYSFSNYVLFIGMGWLTYDAFLRNDNFDSKIFILLAVLYNPFIVIPAPQIIWIIINIFVVIGLILNIISSEDFPYQNYKKR